jgi:hypothetical protein
MFIRVFFSPPANKRLPAYAIMGIIRHIGDGGFEDRRDPLRPRQRPYPKFLSKMQE